MEAARDIPTYKKAGPCDVYDRLRGAHPICKPAVSDRTWYVWKDCSPSSVPSRRVQIGRVALVARVGLRIRVSTDQSLNGNEITRLSATI